MTTVNTDQIVVPSSPADRKKIMDAMVEISASMTRVEGEKDLQKQAVALLVEEFKLPKKYLNKMARAYHKNSYSNEVHDAENFQQLYETITGTTSL